MSFDWHYAISDDHDTWSKFDHTSQSKIEEAYLNNPNTPFTLHVGKDKGMGVHQYLIDFEQMTQKNLATEKVRPIKRTLRYRNDKDD